ncbi:MAG: hypothetical protein KC444_00855 [Nitrosopumilus sp.]|nr:hypothetical protein [Nitrosopumilus sp.]
MPPKGIASGDLIANTKILSEDKAIFVFYELYPQNVTGAEIETNICILEQPEDKAGYAYFAEIGFRLSN